MLAKISGPLYAIADTRSIFIDGLNTLVISDLHLGFEEDLARQGIFLPRRQFYHVIKVIEKILDLLGDSIETIIVNGDLKHCFDRLLRQEKKEVSHFIEYLLDKKIDLVIIRGNHDNYLPIVLKNYSVKLYEDYRVSIGDQKILVTHGHKDVDIENVDYVIIGHEHPSLAIADKLGVLTKVHVYLKVPTIVNNEIIVLPAFGIYQAGNRITLDKDNYLSPIVRKYGVVEEAVPYAIIENEPVIELPKLVELLSI